MKSVELGSTGIEVGPICLGTLQFGTRVDVKTSFAILDAYVEAGGRFIDTANNYSKWHADGVGIESEATIGKWIADRGNRDELVVATKVGINRDDVGPSLSAATIESEFAGSARRLGLDSIDLYFAHADLRSDPLEETLGALDAIVKKGGVKTLGCSNFRAWRIEQARAICQSNGWAQFCCVQQRHTYLRPVPGASFGRQLSSNPDLLDYVQAHDDLSMLAYSPLLSGSYSNTEREAPAQYRDVSNEERTAALRDVATQTGATVNQVVYAWMIQGTPRIIPLVAPTSLAQLSESLGSLQVTLSPEQIEQLSTAGNPR